MYSFIYEEDPVIIYDETPDFATDLKWFLKGRILEDFLAIIGTETEKKALIKLTLEGQNIVEIGNTQQRFRTKELPHDYVPIFVAQWKKKGKERKSDVAK